MKHHSISIPRAVPPCIAASLLVLLLAGVAAPAFAQPASAASAAATSAPGEQSELSSGEITRWDARGLRITLRHGEIRNLGMPPMTMVFRVRAASLVGDLKAGDKVRFRAEQMDGAYHVTHIERAP